MDMPLPEQMGKKAKLNRSGVIGSGGIELSSDKPTKKNKKRKGKLSKRLLVAVVIVLVLGMGIAIYAIFLKGIDLKDPACKSDNLSFDKKLSCTDDPAEKAQIYLERARGEGVATSSESAKSSLADAYEAERLYPSWQTALTIASREYVNGNLKVAIKYYRLFIQRDPSNPDADYYRKHIEYLEKKL